MNSHFRCQGSPKLRIRIRHFIWGRLITPLSITVLPVPFFDGSEIAHCWRPNTGLCIPQVWFIAMEIQCSHCSHLVSGLGCFPTPLLLATVSCGEHPQHKQTLSPFSLFAKPQYLITAFTRNWDNNATFDCFSKPCRGQDCCCSPVGAALLNQPVWCRRSCFFREMALCPEVLALIVATALLSRHHRMQREREIRAAGGG